MLSSSELSPSRIERRVLEVGRKQPHVMRLDFRALLELFRIVLVVRQLVVRIRDVELRVRARALLAAVHERDDAREIALIREHLQVVHEPHVLVEAVRNPDGPFQFRQLARALLFGLLNPSLDVAQRGEVVADFRVVR
jgi:hypothetical protein